MRCSVKWCAADPASSHALSSAKKDGRNLVRISLSEQIRLPHDTALPVAGLAATENPSAQ